MACIITYENKQYTQKEFEQYFKEHFTEFVDNFLGSKQDIKGFEKFVTKPTANEENNRSFVKQNENKYNLEKEITTFKISNKKENIERNTIDGMIEDVGYPVTFDSHPNLKVYLVKIGNNWSVIEKNTGKGLPVRFATTQKDSVQEVIDMLNNVIKRVNNTNSQADINLLQQIGLAKNNKTDFENFKNNFETTKCDE